MLFKIWYLGPGAAMIGEISHNALDFGFIMDRKQCWLPATTVKAEGLRKGTAEGTIYRGNRLSKCHRVFQMGTEGCQGCVVLIGAPIKVSACWGKGSCTQRGWVD
jgi:hypothetical protein